MEHIKRDSWLTLTLCLGVGLFIIIRTMTFPSVKGQGFGQGPGFYPQILAFLLILLGFMVLLQDVRTPKTKSERQLKTVDCDSINSGSSLLVVLVLLICLVATFVMKYCGFIISGFLLTLLVVRLIRAGGQRVFWGRDLVFSMGLIALVYLLFQVFIGIQLPQSILLG